MYQVIQHRTTPGQYDIPAILATVERIKDAIGQQKQQFKSTLEMIMHHDYFDAHYFELDEEAYWVKLFDIDDKEFLYIGFEIKEITDAANE